MQDLKLTNKIYENLKTVGRVAYTTLTYDETVQLGKTPNQACRPNSIANLKGYPFWVFFNEEENGKIRVEYRSNGPCVRNVAVKWGGGGHERAFRFNSELIWLSSWCNKRLQSWSGQMRKIW